MGAEILILGGGFAGLAAAGELARRRPPGLRVRLLDRSPHSTFSPLLPDLISGRVRTACLTHPLARHCRGLGVEFIQADVREIDLERNRVETDAGRFSADALLICTGCENNYYGNEEAKRQAPGLKTVSEGHRIRSTVLEVLRAASEQQDEAPPPGLVVVGGGYTGFEIAGHAACLAHALTGTSYDRLPELFRILIVEKQPEPLSNVSASVRRWGVRLAGRFGIEVRTGCSAESFADDGVALTDGTRLERTAAVWAVGVTPGTAAASLPVSKVGGGRLAVDEFLRLPGHPTVFAAGDVAGARRLGSEAILRMAVQFSLSGGRRAAQNVLRTLQGEPLRPYAPTDLGYVLPLVPGWGSGSILGVELRGRLPGMLHYLMCSARSWSRRNQLGVLRDFIGRRKCHG